MHYVIGDVHGCYDEMIALLSKIEKMDEDAQFIFVGDFVDRGSQVDKVLEWCMKHITLEGKYQAVRGNHEQMVLDWYIKWLKWWNEEGAPPTDWSRMPESEYDFSKWADGMNILSPDKLKPYMDFLSTLPYNKLLEIESKWGKAVSFRVVHADYEYGNVAEDVQRKTNLWKRMNFGNHISEEIIVHGHTPTLEYGYISYGVQDTKPGMISYRKNDINVDGGCVFAKEFPMYPAMLCAIRLEDLEEIYTCSVEERFMQGIGSAIEEVYQKDRLERYISNYLNSVGKCREMLLWKLGDPNYEKWGAKYFGHIPGKPRYWEDQEVCFRENGEIYTGTIESVNPIDMMGENEQPYYDILANVHGTFVLFKQVSESDIVD